AIGDSAAPMAGGNTVAAEGFAAAPTGQYCNFPRGAYVVVDAATGKRRWQRSGSSAVASDRYVAGATGHGAFGVLDARTGTTVAKQISGEWLFGPVLVGDLTPRMFYAHDVRTGQVLWTRTMPFDGFGEVTDDSTLYVRGEQTGDETTAPVVAIDAETGNVRWKQWTTDTDGTLVRPGSTVVSVSSVADAFDSRTGRRLWHRSITPPAELYFGPPATSDDRDVYVYDHLHRLTTIDAASGTSRSVRLAGDVQGLRGASDGVVVVQLTDAIEGFDAHSGTVRWRWSFRAGMAGFGAVGDDGSLYIASGRTCRSSD
ncbi:MAG TPA: PQQ-binding-like beta-propeller repeat protein, partial [Acidimicrobiia bacterium]